MASKGAKKQTGGNRDSLPKYLGVKVFDGEIVEAGNVIVRQRGRYYKPGIGTRIGKDDTIYAVQQGKVKIRTKKIINFTGKAVARKIVEVHKI